MSGSTVIRELVAALGIQVDEAGVAKAEAAMENVTNVVLAVGAAVATAGAALFAMTESVAGASGRLDDLSKRTGLSTTLLQELEYAAKLSGSSLDELTAAFSHLSRNASMAAQGSEEAARAFLQAGVQVRDTHGKLRPLDDLLGDVAARFQSMPDGTKKTAMAMSLFGESGGRLIPLLNEGRDGIAALREEAHALGVVMSSDTVQAGAALDDQFDRLHFTLLGFRNAVVAPLLPALNRFAGALVVTGKRLRPVLAEKSAAWAQRFGDALEFAANNLEHFRVVLAGVATVMLARYLIALSTVTGAQVLAGATALASAVAAAAVWGLLAAVIILAADELYTFVNGGDTALGRLLSWFNTNDVNDTAFVKSIKALGALVTDITDPDKWKRATRAWGKALGFNTLADDGAVRVLPKDASGRRVAPDGARQVDVSSGGAWGFLKFLASQVGFNVKGGGPEVLGVYRGGSLMPAGAALPPQDMSAYFGRGGSPEAAVASAQGARGGSVVFAPNLTFRQEVNAAPGMSAVDVGNAAADGTRDWWQTELRNTYENVKK